jgi:hypothetical protein
MKTVPEQTFTVVGVKERHCQNFRPLEYIDVVFIIVSLC